MRKLIALSLLSIPLSAQFMSTNARRLQGVNIVSPLSCTNNQVLTYSLANTRFECATPPGASGGEANTGSNVGAAGTGIFDNKVGVDLQFRKLNSTANTLTIAQNSQQIDFTIVQANFTLSSLGGSLNLSQIAQGGASSNQILKWNGSAWAPAADAGLVDPMTTRGDLIYRSNSGTTRLALGSNGQCLTSNGTDVVWGSCAGGAGNLNVQADGTLVAARDTLNFITGNTITWTIADTGTKVNATPEVDTAKVLSRATHQAGTDLYCRSATGNDTYTCTLTPTLTAYTRGMVLTLDADTANTGTATVNVDTLGAKSILNRAGGALADGDITANKPILVSYDGTQFVIVGDGATGGSSAFSSLTGGTNTGAAMVVGAGASLRANSADATAPNKSGTSLPGTCTVGDTYIKTDATNTAVTHVCTATNTWTQQNGTAPAPTDDTYANRPTCNAAATGKVFYASDITWKHWICDGSTWRAYGFGMRLTEPPAAASWTTVVSSGGGSPTVTDVGGAIRYVGGSSGGSAIVTAVPGSTPYSVVLAFTSVAADDNGQYLAHCAFVLTDGTSTSSNRITSGILDISNVGGQVDLRFHSNRWTNISTYSSTQSKKVAVTPGMPPIMRYRDDGTNRYFELWDGSGWLTALSETRTTFLTATHYGFTCDSNKGSATLYHWKP